MSDSYGMYRCAHMWLSSHVCDQYLNKKEEPPASIELHGSADGPPRLGLLLCRRSSCCPIRRFEESAHWHDSSNDLLNAV